MKDGLRREKKKKTSGATQIFVILSAYITLVIYTSQFVLCQPVNRSFAFWNKLFQTSFIAFFKNLNHCRFADDLDECFVIDSSHIFKSSSKNCFKQFLTWWVNCQVICCYNHLIAFYILICMQWIRFALYFIIKPMLNLLN